MLGVNVVTPQADTIRERFKMPRTNDEEDDKWYQRWLDEQNKDEADRIDRLVTQELGEDTTELGCGGFTDNCEGDDRNPNSFGHGSSPVREVIYIAI